MAGLREPGDRVERELGAERDDEVVGAQRLAVHDHLPERGIDSLDLAADDLDALALEAVERPRDLCRGAVPVMTQRNDAASVNEGSRSTSTMRCPLESRFRSALAVATPPMPPPRMRTLVCP